MAVFSLAVVRASPAIPPRPETVEKANPLYTEVDRVLTQTSTHAERQKAAEDVLNFLIDPHTKYFNDLYLEKVAELIPDVESASALRYSFAVFARHGRWAVLLGPDPERSRSSPQMVKLLEAYLNHTLTPIEMKRDSVFFHEDSIDAESFQKFKPLVLRIKEEVALQWAADPKLSQLLHDCGHSVIQHPEWWDLRLAATQNPADQLKILLQLEKLPPISQKPSILAQLKKIHGLPPTAAPSALISRPASPPHDPSLLKWNERTLVISLIDPDPNVSQLAAQRLLMPEYAGRIDLLEAYLRFAPGKAEDKYQFVTRTLFTEPKWRLHPELSTANGLPTSPGNLEEVTQVLKPLQTGERSFILPSGTPLTRFHCLSIALQRL